MSDETKVVVKLKCVGGMNGIESVSRPLFLYDAITKEGKTVACAAMLTGEHAMVPVTTATRGIATIKDGVVIALEGNEIPIVDTSPSPPQT